jgi:XTP/dITP diphosphohydrolase
MLKLILATGNNHKAQEFAQIFNSEIIQVKAAEKKLEVIEDGNTFSENALLKARAYYDIFKVPILSDDSGITVEGLPDQLGIHSARFGGDGLTDKDRYELLLQKLENISGAGRQAYFTCVLCFYLSPEEIFFFEGRMNGEVLYGPKGDAGFGYDPVFRPIGAREDESVAQMHEWKQKNSHRALACQYAQRFFEQRRGQS